MSGSGSSNSSGSSSGSSHHRSNFSDPDVGVVVEMLPDGRQRCVARRTGEILPGWAPARYAAAQCERASKAGARFCGVCEKVEETFRTTGKFNRWHGVIGEGIPPKSHIKGSEWNFALRKAAAEKAAKAELGAAAAAAKAAEKAVKASERAAKAAAAEESKAEKAAKKAAKEAEEARKAAAKAAAAEAKRLSEARRGMKQLDIDDLRQRAANLGVSVSNLVGGRRKTRRGRKSKRGTRKH